MRVRCVLTRRKFVPYLEGSVPAGEAGRIEEHLGGCRDCAAFLEKVRAGHEAGRRLGRTVPALPAPEFEAIWRRAIAAEGGRVPDRKASTPLAGPSPSPLAVRVLLVLAASLAVVLVLTDRGPFRRPGAGSPLWGTLTADRGFTPVPIRDFAANSRGRVVTEGFIHKVYFDEEERTLHIRLVETPHGTGPFVICEVRDSHELAIPQEGSRVRVYGTARYDAQPGRGWHEVNPVTDISVLKR